MAQIVIADEILEHDEDEVIYYLYNKITLAKRMYAKSIENNTPEQLFALYGCIDDMYTVLREMNRRNDEKAL